MMSISSPSKKATSTPPKSASTQVGVKGFMNQSFVETLAYKTRRGQIGRAMQGFIPTGNCYGYRLANRIEPDGRIVRGLREIDEVQAATVRRIFELYADGMSAKRIAILLRRLQLSTAV